MERRRVLSSANNHIRNRFHELLQQLEVLQIAVLELASVAHPHMYRKIELGTVVVALRGLVIPGPEQWATK